MCAVFLVQTAFGSLARSSIPQAAHFFVPERRVIRG